ncbi:MAG: AmmeMemoRadiSam system protein B [Planctomycetota bacterium]|jgi:AmmeMemoRadiSam system protein B
METRRAIVAGQFYPGQKGSCLAEIENCLHERAISAELPETIIAGIVPHAGWIFSGSLAALVFSAIKQKHEDIDTFVIFGAAHGCYGQTPAIYNQGSWSTPMGHIGIDEELAQEVLETGLALSDLSAHGHEHSIEVQIPFIQHLFPESKIVPIIVPPSSEAISLGSELGQIIDKIDKKVICIGSTDLTHYGPRYGFTPMGTGEKGTEWAGEVNDRKFIDAALKMNSQALLVDSLEHQNSCGPGAASATIAAAKTIGKREGRLLAYTNSNEVMKEKMHSSSSDSVGYAAIIF